MKREILGVGLILCINFIATMNYLFFLSNEARKKRFFGIPVLLQKSVVLLFVGPLFIWPFFAQPRINFLGADWIKIPLSFLFILGGLTVIMLAFLKIGVVPSLREKSVLITAGVYRLVRHPIYFGTVLAFLGVILFSEAAVSLLYFPVSVGLYYFMTVYEEKSLVAEYGQEYIEYQQKVRKRIIPYVL
jgi:protein-S-isoprenylcysteine O-methyltransferase Ste14